MDSQWTATAPDRECIFVGLSRLLDDSYNHLADTRALYLSTGITARTPDALATAVQAIVERYYSEMALTVDLIIRRMREIGFAGAPTPARSSLFSRLAGTSTTDQLTRWLAQHETLLDSIQALFPPLAQIQDELTARLLQTRTAVHVETARQLRALLPGAAPEPPRALRAAG